MAIEISPYLKMDQKAIQTSWSDEAEELLAKQVITLFLKVSRRESLSKLAGVIAGLVSIAGVGGKIVGAQAETAVAQSAADQEGFIMANRPAWNMKRWFPIFWQKAQEVDEIQLHAPGGPLAVYDAIFGTNARGKEEELANWVINNAPNTFSFAGHCSARVSACLSNPQLAPFSYHFPNTNIEVNEVTKAGVLVANHADDLPLKYAQGPSGIGAKLEDSPKLGRLF